MRYAICNETFEDWDHARVCRFVADAGYQGLEVAPFTLAARVTDIPAERRRELRWQAEACGLQIIGLHWLLARTEGLQLTAADEATRRRTADYLVELARFCRDLGGELMVFGSPAQRRIPAGATRAQAVDWAVDTFRRALPGIVAAGVKLCLEPLSPPEADFINTCAEAVEILDRIGHPNFCLHLDVKAMATDGPAPELIRRHAARTGHFHANDVNRRGPGFGSTDFVPIFRALKEVHYHGWVSVEVFDYSPDPETIARDSLRYMRQCESST
jgi:sugar phosphate isomerase/epimerase